jgi:hypothetical protein
VTQPFAVYDTTHSCFVVPMALLTQPSTWHLKVDLVCSSRYVENHAAIKVALMCQEEVNVHKLLITRVVVTLTTSAADRSEQSLRR